MTYCIILTTCPDEKSANELASMLVEKKLAACVQLSSVKSFYCWKQKQNMDDEIRLTIKTKNQLYPAVEAFIKKHHPYEVPQIIQMPISKGSDEYLEWITDNTRGPKE